MPDLCLNGGCRTPVLKSARLMLRAPVPADLERLAKLANDADIARMLERMPHPYSRADGEAWLAGLGRDPAKLEFAVDDGSGFIGGLSLRGLDETPVIGYWLGRPYWGRGYMSEAAGTALAWIFETRIFGARDAQAVEARAMTENTASRNVLTKLGFRDIGETDCASLACGTSRPARRYRLDRTTYENRNRGHAPGQA